MVPVGMRNHHQPGNIRSTLTDSLRQPTTAQRAQECIVNDGEILGVENVTANEVTHQDDLNSRIPALILETLESVLLLYLQFNTREGPMPYAWVGRNPATIESGPEWNSRVALNSGGCPGNRASHLRLRKALPTQSLPNPNLDSRRR